MEETKLTKTQEREALEKEAVELIRRLTDEQIITTMEAMKCNM